MFHDGLGFGLHDDFDLIELRLSFDCVSIVFRLCFYQSSGSEQLRSLDDDLISNLQALGKGLPSF